MGRTPSGHYNHTPDLLGIFPEIQGMVLLGVGSDLGFIEKPSLPTLVLRSKLRFQEHTSYLHMQGQNQISVMLSHSLSEIQDRKTAGKYLP